MHRIGAQPAEPLRVAAISLALQGCHRPGLRNGFEIPQQLRLLARLAIPEPVRAPQQAIDAGRQARTTETPPLRQKDDQHAAFGGHRTQPT